ncbi:sensor histidine kinase [Gemmatimonas sp.]|uniref:sensor histidine kinase n=1 Tax=Gemmatimonas sp. TaxID=1962908 RepID=UPI0025BE0231|nr:sensor histidine kinase [Gemmatimonas sp.]MCA2991153.1 HAMP domain-containing protein [Gemmatimonas sp.]
MPEIKRPSIHDRLQRVLVAASAGLIIAIITTMWFTEELPAGIRWPLVVGFVFVVALFSASILQRLVARLIEEPLGHCVQAADAIARGDVAQLVPPASTQEFHQLATSINHMTEQMAAATQSRMRVEKLATMGRIAAGISHEIGNPVSAIANYAHLLRMRTQDVQGTTEPLDALEREITRIDRIMRGLLDYARPRRLTPKPIVVDDIIEDVLRLLADQGITRRFRVTRQLEAPDGVVYAERHDLEQAFVNLLLNAVDAMDREGEIVIRSRINDATAFGDSFEKRRTDPHPQRWAHRPSKRALAWLARPESPPRFLQVVLADSGTGVAPEDAERIFEPFFSTKQPGKGTGLGLAIVASTIENLGGTIWVQRAREGGAAFVILLPLHASGVRPITPPNGEAVI